MDAQLRASSLAERWRLQARQRALQHRSGLLRRIIKQCATDFTNYHGLVLRSGLNSSQRSRRRQTTQGRTAQYGLQKLSRSCSAPACDRGSWNRMPSGKLQKLSAELLDNLHRLQPEDTRAATHDMTRKQTWLGDGTWTRGRNTACSKPASARNKAGSHPLLHNGPQAPHAVACNAYHAMRL